MEVAVYPAQSEGMKTSMLVAGILTATLTAHAHDSKHPDVIVYVKGGNSAPSSVDQGARATVTWMFARIGVRVGWRDGEPRAGTSSNGPATIQVRFTTEAPAGVSQSALARALPFDEGDVAVTIMYDRIRWAARQLSREAPILAHVLAHEIGHVLQGTDAHAPTGVMKAHWTGEDYDAMRRKPLEFTSVDVALIRDGLTKRKAQSASRSKEALPL